MEYLEFTGKSVDEALASASASLGMPSDQIEYKVIEEASAGFLGLFNAKPAKIQVVKKASIEDVVKKFLNDMFNAMDMTVEINVSVDEAEETVNIDLSGEEMGLLIGKRGQTLDSLQYLVRLVVNKEFGGYLKVKVDTENYRERRKDTLESLAKNISFKVKKTRRSVVLEPMNPYERRIIHSTLQNDKYVATKSEGEEPFRHVVVYLKKQPYENKRTYGNSRYGKDKFRRYSETNTNAEVTETVNDTVVSNDNE